MLRLVLTLIVAATLTGCATRHYKADNPVVGPPPPRIPGRAALADNEADGPKTALGQSEFLQAKAETTVGSTEPLPMTAIAARVNGQPILVGTVLAERRKILEANRSRLSDAQYREIQEKLIQEKLPTYIEQALMVHAVKMKLKPEQLKAVNEQLDAHFEEHIDKIRRDMKATSVAEVEVALQQAGLTMSMMRQMIGDRALAEQYMMTKLEEQPVITAPELRAAFQERKAEFTEPEQVKWQQIQISLRNYENDSDAEQAAKEALAALQKGTPFDDVAKEYSDGPDAANGGHWDWTQPESLPAELKETLQTLPPGKPSGLIRTETNLQIVRIVERKDERVRPFEEVQDQIRKDLRSQSQQDRAKKIVDELKASAVIETMFDSPTITASATPAEETPSPPRFSTISRQGS